MKKAPSIKTETTKPSSKTSRVLKEGLDFYYEGGYMVFTEHFLLARGYCCGSGCRHCPYKKDIGMKKD